MSLELSPHLSLAQFLDSPLPRSISLHLITGLYFSNIVRYSCITNFVQVVQGTNSSWSYRWNMVRNIFQKSVPISHYHIIQPPLVRCRNSSSFRYSSMPSSANSCSYCLLQKYRATHTYTPILSSIADFYYCFCGYQSTNNQPSDILSTMYSVLFPHQKNTSCI